VSLEKVVDDTVITKTGKHIILLRKNKDFSPSE
jgi:hypothetical protein